MSVNTITLDGNLTRDPELRTVGDGAVCSFRIAHNTKAKGEEHTDYFDVSAWGRLGEICSQYLEKGRAVVVSGRLTVREFEHQGEKRTGLEIQAAQVHFVGAAAQGRSADSAADTTPTDGGSIPF